MILKILELSYLPPGNEEANYIRNFFTERSPQLDIVHNRAIAEHR